MYGSFYDGDESIEVINLEVAIGNTVPLSTTMENRIDRLRKWADGRARKANTSLDSDGHCSLEVTDRSSRRRVVG